LAGGGAPRQGDKVRRIGVLMGFSEQDSEARRWGDASERRLAELGWKEGIDLRIEYRWLRPNPPDQLRAYAAEMVNLSPDPILVTNPPTLAFASIATRTIPIVFTNVTSANLERHYGNVTGTSALEPQVAEEWISVLKEFAPGIEHVGFLNVPTSTPKEFFQHVEATATWRGLKLVPAALPLLGGPTLTIAQFAAEPKWRSRRDAELHHRTPSPSDHQCSCAVSRAERPSVLGSGRRPDFLFNRYRAVFPTSRVLHRPHPKRRNACRPAATASYSVRFGHQLKTAKAPGLEVPPSILLRADEVIG
jgi:putative tryptophan/tyrosine transport system substrate-binding protein